MALEGAMAKAAIAKTETTFAGFPPQTLEFLKGIAAHNDKAWFEANRPLYEAGYVAPARAFVEAIGPRLRGISPSVQFEPKVNGSMGRINRDIRFSKDKRPYKDHLDLWFWHGDRKSWDSPGFWFSLSASKVSLGVGLYAFDKEALDSFRQSVIHPRSGRALLKAVADVKAAGLEVGGKTRKLMPRGFTADADRAEYLLHEGLYTSTTLPTDAALKPDFVDRCVTVFSNAWPIGKWLLAEVSG
jgi:uncharacterized protein (TIGR02453 family)